MQPTPPARTTHRALVHVPLAGLLGVLAAYGAAPYVVGSLFGGGTTFLITVLLVVAVVSAVAVGLDLVAGPRPGDRGGSVLRGIVLGVVGTVASVVIAFAAFRFGWARGMTLPMGYAAAAVPFAAVAALQWRGVIRIVTAVAILAAAAAVVIPRARDALAEGQEQRVVTELGTTAHPWVTEIDGLEGLSPHDTGTDYIWTPYPRPGSTEPVVDLLRMADEAAPGGDPCAGAFYTPDGDFPATSCTRGDDGTWFRVADTYWQQLITRIDGTWIAATATPDVPRALLEEALRNARPMTDDEYDDWLGERLPG